MNRIFSVIWNHSLNAFVVTSEHATRHGKRSSSGAGAVLAFAVGAITVLPAVGMAADLPTGGTVVQGSGQIGAANGNQMTITQSTDKMAINWQSFDIGKDHKVTFVQPGADSIALNRVIGSDGSKIMGQLDANGRVFLINPNGVVFGKGASVNVGGLVASTLDLSDKDFADGKYTFKGNGSNAAVVNQGSIKAAEGGAVALLGGSVSNQGVISAKMGSVAMAAGNTVTVDFAGDGLLKVQIDEATKNALVDNKALIQADGGQVLMTASASDALLKTVVNNTGVIEARTLQNKGGKIVLGGGSHGVVQVAGSVDASAPAGKGGAIEITGQHIAVSGAQLDVSGTQGGGSIKVGGDYQGSGTLAHAQSVSVDKNSRLKADAGQVGDGGKIIVWSDGATTTKGKFSAKGGAQSGKGGLVETSGHQVDFTDISVDTSAAKGATGDWLVDPENITVDAAAANTINTALATSNVTLQTTSTTASGSGTKSSGAGDIIVNSALNWSSSSKLKLDAFNSIAINANININGAGGLVLVTNNNVGKTSSGLGVLSFGNGASASFNAPKGSGQSLTINGSAYTLIHSMADLDGIDGVAASDKGINVQDEGMAGNYALAKNLDAAGTTYNDSLISSANFEIFSGTLEGLGHSVANLKIDSESWLTGLIGMTYDARVANIGLINADIRGIDTTGGLVAFNDTSKIYNSYVTGKVSGGWSVGGLAGYNSSSTIENSFMAGEVSGTQEVGGLAGSLSYGTIKNSFSMANVNGDFMVGGLVGSAFHGTLTSNLVTGNVTGGNAGALIGDNDASVVQNNYWNTDTNSATVGIASGTPLTGTVGLTTQGLQGSTLLSGFDSKIWGASAGLYPYLKSLSPSGVQANKGTVTVNGGLANSGTVNIDTAGLLGTGAIGKNGYYYIAMPVGTQAADPTAFAYLGDLSAGQFIPTLSLGNLAFTRNSLNLSTAGSSLSALLGDTRRFGAGAQTVIANMANVNITATGASFSLDSSLNWSQNVKVNAAGALSIDSALAHATRFEAQSQGSLTIGSNGRVSADNVVLSTPGAFYNLGGSNAVTATGGHWVIYAANPTGSQFGGLNSRNTAVWNADINSVAANSLTGNRYVFRYQPTLTYSTTNVSKTYGDSVVLNNGYSVSGLSAGVANAFAADTLQNVVSGSAKLSSAGLGATANAGTYAINVERGSLVATNGYNLAFGTGALLTVDRKALTVTANSGRSTYGDSTLANPGVTVKGLVNGDTANGFSTSVAIDSRTNAGSYVLTVNGALDNGNYLVTKQNGQWVVDPKALIVTANSGRSTYGDSQFGNPGLSASGLVNGDTLAGLSTSVAINSRTGAGSYVLTVNGTLNNGNYAVTRQNGQWTVDPKALLVVANSGSSTYGDSALANGGLSATGLVNGDTLDGLSTSVPINSRTNVGTYALTVDGTLNNRNYTVTTQNGKWVVGQKDLTVVANGGSSTYGDALSKPGLTAIGLVNDDELTGLSNSFNLNNYSAAGTYALNVRGTLSNTNYRVTKQNGEWVIGQKDLTVTAKSGTSVYGDGWLATPGLLASGLVNGDNLYGLTNSFNASGINGTSNAGTYALSVNGTLKNPNYRVTTQQGEWVVTPKALTVTALSGQSTYGDTNMVAPGLSIKGLVNGDKVSGLSNSFDLNNTSNAGNYVLSVEGVLNNSNYTVTTKNGQWVIAQKALTVTANGGSSIYGDTLTNPGLSATGLVNGDTLAGLSNNFDLDSTSNAGWYTLGVVGTLENSNYRVSTRKGTWVIGQKALQVTAKGGESTYGDSIANPGLDAVGLVNGDTLSGLYNNFNGTNMTNAGTYVTAVRGTLENLNYKVSRTSGSFVINKKDLVVSANGGGSNYGDVGLGNPGLSALGLVNGDTLSGLRNSFALGSNSAVGTYALTVLGNMSNRANYNITRESGEWVVDPKVMKVASGI